MKIKTILPASGTTNRFRKLCSHNLHSAIILLLILAVAALGAPATYAQTIPEVTTSQPGPEPHDGSTLPAEPTGWWASQPKENKLLYTDIGMASLIIAWGYMEWDYQSSDFNMAHEGWFGKNTKYGGADKCGHFWSTYAFSDAFTALYKGWGYSSTKANMYAALSAWTVQGVMELGDMTSKSQGFSWEDMAANTLGALTSILMERYPELDRKIDFRVQYEFNEPVNGIFDDYSNLTYSMVLKLDGFDATQDTFLKYLELQAGYYTRGYGDNDHTNDSRSVFLGISFNFSRLFQDKGYTKTGKVLEYFQLPYTVPKVHHSID